ncbi:MAG TPA: hypothetical protein VLS89_08530, partial [Candidatus Nanopelagicales bacterium]|nr:hypothetical protein [Candidatus Nanopelagicales bacterium]
SAAPEVIVVRGTAIARRSFDGDADPSADPSVEGDAAAGCLGAHDACGSLVFPLEISLLGSQVSGVETLRAGESVTLEEGYGTLHLVRAEERPIRDTACFPESTALRHYESVLVIPAVMP